MLKRIGRRLTFANLASAAALFVALGGGTALAIGSNTGPAANDSAASCRSGLLTVDAGASAPLCTVGSLTLTGACTVFYGDRAVGQIQIETSTDHAFYASDGGSDGNFNVTDSPGSLAHSGPSTGGWAAGGGSFSVAEAHAAGGHHLGGTAVARARFTTAAGHPKCQFAVDALTS
jgi:hypothetical protein